MRPRRPVGLAELNLAQISALPMQRQMWPRPSMSLRTDGRTAPQITFLSISSIRCIRGAISTNFGSAATDRQLVRLSFLSIGLFPVVRLPFSASERVSAKTPPSELLRVPLLKG